MSLMGLTEWAAPTGEDQGLSGSATTSGGGPAWLVPAWHAAQMDGSCRVLAGTWPPPQCQGAETELQHGWPMPLAYDFWGWPAGWRPVRSETLRFTLVAVLEGSTLSEGLEWDFFRPSSSPLAASKSVDSNAARSSEPAFSLARSSMA